MNGTRWTFVLVAFLASLQGTCTTIVIQRLMARKNTPKPPDPPKRDPASTTAHRAELATPRQKPQHPNQPSTAHRIRKGHHHMTEYEWKLRRADKRILAVLLTGATNLGNFTIYQLSGAGGRTAVVLARLERCGIVTTEREVLPPMEDRPARRFYRLTPAGRRWAARTLRLEIPQ